MRTIDKIIDKVNCTYGAPMGRANHNSFPTFGRLFTGMDGRLYFGVGTGRDSRVFDCAVPLDSGGYDKGGAYWGTGTGRQLRAQYTKDLTYIRFYRLGEV